MASIKQIIAEIQLADYLPTSHKQKVVQIIRDAEERLKIKGVNSRPRKVSNVKNAITLEEWENIHGPLRSTMMWDWIRQQKLCPQMIAKMIQEFRTEMQGKGKQYANFRAAFQTYLAKGYLSKPITACTLERSPYKSETVIETKGGVL